MTMTNRPWPTPDLAPDDPIPSFIAGHTDWQVMPNERAGPPLARHGRRRLLRWLVLLLAASGAAWAWRDDRGVALATKVWQVAMAAGGSTGPVAGGEHLFPPSAPRNPPQSLPVATPPGSGSAAEQAPLPTAVASSGEPAPESIPASLPASPAASPPGQPEPRADADAPSEAAQPAPAPAEADNEGAAPQPLPPPPAYLSPIQKRAEAAGLNPGISDAVLARLSAADFRNVGEAIRRALATTPADRALEWPVHKRRGMAQFRVHFVPSDNAKCRRYVVTIARDGWATTAPPMEKCGLPRVRAAEASANRRGLSSPRDRK